MRSVGSSCGTVSRPRPDTSTNAASVCFQPVASAGAARTGRVSRAAIDGFDVDVPDTAANASGRMLTHSSTFITMFAVLAFGVGMSG